MGSGILSSAVGVHAPADLYVDRFGPLAGGRVASRELAPGPAVLGEGAGLTRGLGHLFGAIASLGEVVVLAYAFPLAILVVGVPIALLVRLVMWTVGLS